METISVCVPAREEAATIAAVVRPLMALREAGVIDQVVVVDASSSDGTGEIAARLGAEVHRETDLATEFGPPAGKGDAIWRGLSVLTGDLVCFVDADTEGFGEHFACGLLGPLVCEPRVQYVKAFFRRPFRSGAGTAPSGGGRVTELTARPLLEAFYPPLGQFLQPLAGEMAGRRELLEQVSFCTGYGVEIGLLIDLHALVGLDEMAQVDLDVRQNRHQTIAGLAPMSAAVLAAVTARLRREGRLAEDALAGELVERPPPAQLRALRGAR